MTLLKKITKLVLIACLAVSMTSCGLLGALGAALGYQLSEDDITLLVQGNIDLIYKGTMSEEYLDLVTGTEEQGLADYENGLRIEAEYFAYYWGIIDYEYDEAFTDLDESLQTAIIDLYREIYSHASYEVQDAVRQSDGSYTVKVLVNPIDIMELADDLYMNDKYAPLNAFWEKYENADFENMPYEDYEAYVHEYGWNIVQLVRDQLPKLGYGEQKSIVVQVAPDEDGLLTISEDDFGILDSYIITYP